MLFAGWRRLYPAELRADFQQYYGLNLDRMGIEYTVLHAADLAVMLPRGSRVLARIDPATEWTIEAQIMAASANAARDLVWLEADPKRRRSNRLEPIMPPSSKAESAIEPIDEEDYLETLEYLRKAVRDG